MNHSLLPSWRLYLAVAGFFGSFFLYSLRINMSMAVVCMTLDGVTINVTTHEIGPGNISDGGNFSSNNPHVQRMGEFRWSKTLRGVLLGSFFVGYMITQIPGGWLAGKYGGRKVVFWSMLILTLGTLLTPISARIHPYVLIFVRICEGLSSGLFYPAFHAMWSVWAPPTERSRLIGIVMIGNDFGNLVTYSTSGFLCEYGFDGGWPSIFYIYGAASLLFFILWAILIFDFPSTHPWISPEEAHYIESNTPKAQDRPPTPWFKILSSSAVWAIYISQLGNGFIGYTVLTCLPTYLKEVLRFNIRANGLFNALPFLCQAFGTLLAAFVSDKILEKKLLKCGTTRKIMEFITLVPTAVIVVVVSYLTYESRILAVVLLCFAVGFVGFGRSGYMANMVDIAPRYAGEIMGIGNCIATICGIVTPIIASELTPNGTAEEWRKVFFICASFCIIGITTFIIVGRGEVQSWADDTSLRQDAGDQIKLIGKASEPKSESYGSTK